MRMKRPSMRSGAASPCTAAVPAATAKNQLSEITAGNESSSRRESNRGAFLTCLFVRLLFARSKMYEPPTLDLCVRLDSFRAGNHAVFPPRQIRSGARHAGRVDADDVHGRRQRP